MAVGGAVFGKQGWHGAVHLTPSFGCRRHVHRAVEPHAPRRVFPGATQVEALVLLGRARHVAVGKHIAVGAGGSSGGCGDDIAVARVATWQQAYVAVVEVYGSAAADEVDGAAYLAVLEVGGAAIVGVVCVLSRQQAHVSQYVAAAVLLVECHSPVGKSPRVVLVVRPQLQVLHVGAVGAFQKQRTGDADTLVPRTVFNLCRAHALAYDAGVGSRERGHGAWKFHPAPVLHRAYHVAVALDAIILRVNKDAEPLRLVGPVVGGMYGIDKSAIARHDEVVGPFPLSTACGATCGNDHKHSGEYCR